MAEQHLSVITWNETCASVTGRLESIIQKEGTTSWTGRRSRLFVKFLLKLELYCWSCQAKKLSKQLVDGTREGVSPFSGGHTVSWEMHNGGACQHVCRMLFLARCTGQEVEAELREHTGNTFALHANSLVANRRSTLTWQQGQHGR